MPFTVSVNWGPPARALCGERLVMLSDGEIVNVNGVGAGVVLRLTDAVPGDAINAAGTVAVSCPEFTKFVVRVAPFQVTCMPEMKFAPLTVNVKPAPPDIAEFGERLLSVGAGLIVNVTAGGTGTPGFTTVIVAVPAVVINDAGTLAVNCPELTKFVVNPVPFHRTTVLALNPAPLTVNVNPGAPASAVWGEILVIPKMLKVIGVGAGFAVILIDAVPGVAIREAATFAVSWPELTHVVGITVPFQVTWVSNGKFEPFTVSVRAPPPATANVGEIVSRVAGLSVISKNSPFEIDSFSATVTSAVPGNVRKLAGTVTVIWVAVGVPTIVR